MPFPETVLANSFGNGISGLISGVISAVIATTVALKKSERLKSPADS